MPTPRELQAKFTEAFNSHDESGVRALYAPGVVFTAPGDVRLQGQDAATAYAMAWLNAFPDGRITIGNEVAEGPWVAQEFTFEGTHRAPLAMDGNTVPPTGKRLVGRGTQLIRYENDLIAELNLYFDQVQVLTQLGLMPAGVPG